DQHAGRLVLGVRVERPFRLRLRRLPPPLPRRVRPRGAPCRSVVGLSESSQRNPLTMNQPTFIKIAADGTQLPDDATDWVAVHLPAHGLTFTATSVVDTDVPHADCEASCKALTLAGHSDWDLPTIDEMQLLIDRTRHDP